MKTGDSTAVWLEKCRAWPSMEKHACRKREHQSYNLKSRPQVSSQGVLRKSTLVFCLPSQSYQWLTSHLTIKGSLPCHPQCRPRSWPPQSWPRDAPLPVSLPTAAIYPASSPFSYTSVSCKVSRLTLPFVIHSFPSSFHFVKSFTAIHSWLSLLLPSKYNQNLSLLLPSKYNQNVTLLIPTPSGQLTIISYRGRLQQNLFLYRPASPLLPF